MQYVRSVTSSVSKGWNSINPATLSGAIDVIVVQQEDGSLACSPFHVRFGKVQILRPYDRKVEFKVNGVKQDYSMKLGEGGEAFFVFETRDSVPEGLQTSPLVSPDVSPQPQPAGSLPTIDLAEPEPLDLAKDTQNNDARSRALPDVGRLSLGQKTQSELGDRLSRSSSLDPSQQRPKSGDWVGSRIAPGMPRAATDDAVPTMKGAAHLKPIEKSLTMPLDTAEPATAIPPSMDGARSASPPPMSLSDAVTRAMNLSKKLQSSNIPTQVTETGDLMLDIQGYKSSDEEALRAEAMARKILQEELEGNYDVGASIAEDESGRLWIYSSEEAKEAAARKSDKTDLRGLNTVAMTSSDAISDPGYHSDDGVSDDGTEVPNAHFRRDSDSAVGLSTPPKSPEPTSAGDPNRNYAKTLRLTNDQLKAMDLKPGSNSMSFTVNRSVCQAFIYLWTADVPVVISDIDGTITKSDALGHVFTMIGRDWTHLGVAKLFTDIVANGYNILYLTSRSVGLADTTRGYLNGVMQEGYTLPKGPVIMSPDRTAAALRRELYLRKPEVFKMACLRDIMGLFNKGASETPFYAGFGNRFTDALSYRSVNIPQTRIFTINSNSEVSLDLLTLNKYKTGYASMREIVDHYFPPVTMLVKNGGEEFTDFNYWRERPLDIEDFSGSESEEEYDENDDMDDGVGLRATMSVRSEDEGTEGGYEGEEDLEASYMSRESMDESIIESIEGDERASYERPRGSGLELGQEVSLTEEEAERLLRAAEENGEFGMLDFGDEGDEASTPAADARGKELKVDLNELAHVLNEREGERQENHRDAVLQKA
ncbi:LNS2-domain-containing protein [Aulographum hederae CBS 113979]|uniref:LNS2-domain-containing protein n=1 Tax=Aulographum hederae CBS 113979 TaxID=1176131 RepID=A0A6G1H600_9PEZI|nr:LNS2-domain-containing protein [Aulographum hederae CBS 113979]